MQYVTFFPVVSLGTQVWVMVLINSEPHQESKTRLLVSVTPPILPSLSPLLGNGVKNGRYKKQRPLVEIRKISWILQMA